MRKINNTRYRIRTPIGLQWFDTLAETIRALDYVSGHYAIDEVITKTIDRDIK
jgi:hypothetical protein